MLKKFANYPARKQVGILAILLGILAIFIGSPFNKTETKINNKELSLISADEISNVEVEDLADDIVKSKFDYRLVDLRNEAEFQKYNIPTSENITVEELLSSDLSRNNNIILYSDNDIEATQAWFILTANDYKGVSLLKGGLNAWQENILFPVCTCGENPTIEQKHKHAKLAEVSQYFGGKMRTEKALEAQNNMEMPEIAPPAQITLKKPKGKRKREGC
jgi:rhodanese-related sulfurtransferase